MANAKELIGDILSSQRVAQSRVFSSRVYDDEPLLFTGSQMRNFLPDRYREMRQLGAPEYVDGNYRRPSQTQLFVRQARFMEDWEDDFPYKGSFKRYYPTYSMMNDQQLRGYFTWRTKVRAGQIDDASLSYAFVYVYELLNGIGASAPQACFDRMLHFWKGFRKVNSGLDAYVPAWLRDFVVYHDLPASLFEQLVDLSFEKALITLRAYERQSASDRSQTLSDELCKDLWDALTVLSYYDIGTSKVLCAQKDNASRVAAQVIARLSVHYAKKRKKGLAESWFGSPQVTEHAMFPSAVFHEEHKHPDCRFDVNEVHSYSCKDGNWYALRRYKKPMPSNDLGELMRAIEHFLCADATAPLDDANLKLPKYQVSMVRECVQEVRKQVADAERRRVVIDRSSLEGIRKRAAGTREQLLTEDERAENPIDGSGVFYSEAEDIDPRGHGSLPVADESGKADVVDSDTSAASAVESTKPVAFGIHFSSDPDGRSMDNSKLVLEAVTSKAIEPSLQNGEQGSDLFDLTEEELSFLDSLLQGSEPSETSDKDLLVDSMNEKLFDLLGDTALEFGDFGPQVIDEYTQELEKVVSSWKSR